MPPFNKEIEDFAQAFSSGYGMTKSKAERESEQLTLQHQRFLNERDPIEAGQKDESHAIEMERARGEISDAEAARRQHELLDPIAVKQATETLEGTQTTNEFNRLKLGNLPTEIEQGNKLTGLQIEGAGQDVEIKKGQLADARLARERLPVEWKQKDQAAADAHADAVEVLKTHAELNTSAMVDARRRVAAAEVATAEANARVAKEGATDEALAQKREAIQAEIDAHKAATAASNAAASAVPSEIKLRESTSRHQDAESDKIEMTNELFANARKAAQRLQGGQPLDEPVEAVDPSLSGPRVRGKPVIPSLQAPTPSWGATTPGPQSAVEVPVSTIGTHDDKSEGITKGSKNSPTAKTMRKLKNGEIPSFSDLIDVGVEASVNAAKSAADDAGIHNDEAVSTPGSELNFSNWLKGAHGADAATAQMAIDTVKEVSKGRLSPQQEALSTTGLGYLTFSLAGMPDEALNFAKGMQGYAQQLTGQYAAFAKAAAANGDVDATTMSLMKSYMNIPNGKDLDIRPDPKHEGMFIAKITDTRTGKVEEEHVVTPDEMVGKAMGVTPGTSMEILNAAAGKTDDTISDAAARVLAAEYKDYGMTAEEISKMTTAEWDQIKGRMDKDIEARKPKEYTQDQVNTADTSIATAIETLRESPKVAKELTKLGFDDPDTGAEEDIAPVAAQILLRSEGRLNPQRALRAAMSIVSDGPDELWDQKDGNLLVSVHNMDPFIISAPNYAVLSVYRNKVGIHPSVDQPPIPPGFGEEKPSADTTERKLGRGEIPSKSDLRAPGSTPPPHKDWRQMEESIHSPSVPFNPYPFLPQAQTGQAVPTTPYSGPTYQPPASIIPKNDTPWYWRTFSN